jgi:hypothetical protein
MALQMTSIDEKLSAAAVAIARSFGLGGREAAARLAEHRVSQWRGD